MGTAHCADWTLYRLTYAVRGRNATPVERYAATRRAAETAAVPVLAASWQVAPGDVAITRIDEVTELTAPASVARPGDSADAAVRLVRLLHTLQREFMETYDEVPAPRDDAPSS